MTQNRFFSNHLIKIKQVLLLLQQYLSYKVHCWILWNIVNISLNSSLYFMQKSNYDQWIYFTVGTEYIPTTPFQRRTTVTTSEDLSEEKASTTPIFVTSVSTSVQILIDSDVSAAESDICSCMYPVQDDNLVATSDGKKLEFQDQVMDGSVVKFRCQHAGYHRFAGPLELKCENCRQWHSSQFPTCSVPRAGK